MHSTTRFYVKDAMKLSIVVNHNLDKQEPPVQGGSFTEISMRPDQRLTLLARGQVARISKEGLVRWEHTPKDTREAYLKEHPRSAYKDIRVNTMGERVSKDPANREVAETAKNTLTDMGFKKKTNIKDTAAHLAEFLKARREHRETFAKKGIHVALSVLRKFKPEDKKELKDEAEDIVRDPRKKPSHILNGRRKALIAGVVGIGVCAALFGTGLLDPNIVAYVGIKALDIGASTISKSLDASSLDEFLIASVIGSFVTSKHGEEYGSGMMGRLKRAYGELMGRPKEEDGEDESKEKDDDIDSSPDKTDTNDNDPSGPSNSNNNDADGDSDGETNDQKEKVEDPQDITIQRPTPQRLKAISDSLEQAGLSVSVEKKPTQPGQLQQSIQISLEDGSPDAFKRAVSKLGLVHVKTLRPITDQDIGQSVTGYLT